MIYMFLADGFEEVEALTPLDLLRRAGADIALPVTNPVEGAHTQGCHGGISPLSGQVYQKNALPVGDKTASDVGGIVDMGGTGGNDPAVRPGKVFSHKEAAANCKNQNKDQNDPGTGDHSIHLLRSSLPGIDGQQSWHSAGYPLP